MNLRDYLERRRARKEEDSLFARLEREHRFDLLSAGGSWADEAPDPGDDNDRGECAA